MIFVKYELVSYYAKKNRKIMIKLKILLLIILTTSPIISQTWTKFNLKDMNIEYSDFCGLDVDSKQNIWFASLGGLIKFDGTNWTLYDTTNSDLPSNRLSSIGVDLEDNIWVGMGDNYGVSVFDGASWINYNRSNSELDTYSVFDINFDKNNNPWLGSWKFLWTKKNNKWVQIKHRNSGDRITYYVLEVDVDKNNDIWYITSVNGVYRYKDGTLKNYDTGIKQFYYDGLSVDSNNNIWFVNSDNYLIRLNAESEQYELIDTNSIPYETEGFAPIRTLFDKNNNLWLAQRRSLYQYNPISEEWTTFTIPDSVYLPLPGDGGFREFILDANGNFWFISSLYIYRLSGAITDVNSEPESSHINIYPNPTKSILNIETDIIYPITEVSISDLQGKVLLSHKNAISNNMSINIQSLEMGAYFLKIATSNGVQYAKKFVKE